ncbi:uncharacterized protein LOC117580511 [Drosophila guanche]|uniref:Uncharacterized protein n=1 Tax=Drosophila guanche TaxID=7266 RepID=A0A3B0JP87_DROGU|nr:uncharacterized protein LOC117580511 [Drosophila guanche]SPP75136.1 Hypothetical predicted protein [Drosophila guanche]
MYNSIEITDSDDEDNSVVDAPERSESLPPSGASKTYAVNETTPRKVKPASLENDASPSSSDKTGTSPGTGADNDKCNAKGPGGRQRSRKSQHQTLRMSPADLQFETIALEDEETRRANKAPKLHTDEPPLQANVVDAISKLIADDEMQALIKRIARERVRCNFLLATYQLPDMNFALNTQTNTLRHQFRERLRQRNERNLSNSVPISRPTAAHTPNANKVTNKGIVRARQPQP